MTTNAQWKVPRYVGRRYSVFEQRRRGRNACVPCRPSAALDSPVHRNRRGSPRDAARADNFPHGRGSTLGSVGSLELWRAGAVGRVLAGPVDTKDGRTSKSRRSAGKPARWPSRQRAPAAVRRGAERRHAGGRGGRADQRPSADDRRAGTAAGDRARDRRRRAGHDKAARRLQPGGSLYPQAILCCTPFYARIAVAPSSNVSRMASASRLAASG